MTDIVQSRDSYAICSGGAVLAKILPCAGAADSFTKLEEGAWIWRRHTDVPTDHMKMEVVLLGEPTFTMVPAVSYNGNGWGTTPEYVGDSFEGKPWTYASHRVTIPSCTYSENDQISIALMAEAKDSSACSLYKTEEGERHVLIFPEEEGPKTLQRHFWGEPFVGSMEPRCDFQGILLAVRSDGSRHRYAHLMDFAWRYYAHPIKPPMTAEELYRLSIAFGRYLFEREKSGFAAFTNGAQWHLGVTAYKKTEHSYEIGWVGQSASLANAFIWDFMRSGDRENLQMALDAHDSWLKFGSFPAGHFASRLNYDAEYQQRLAQVEKPDPWDMGECMYETLKGMYEKRMAAEAAGKVAAKNKTKRAMTNACNVGTGAEGYFEAYRLLKEIGIDKPEYLRAAYAACDFALKTQSESGEYAKTWDSDGNVVIRKGTVGAFLILPMITAYRSSGDRKYLDSAVSAFDFYYNSLERDGFTTAGALDTYCIDKESASPLLRDALEIYAVTSDKKYLTAAEKIAWYLCTWMMHFTVRYPEDSLIGKMGYDTFGSTSVSTAHQALDQYAQRDVLSFLKLYELTGAAQWRERALAFWCNACQCVSDGTQFINGRIRPAGSQDEAIFHTRWGRYGVSSFSPSQWLPAWPCAFRLENFRWHPDWTLFDEGLLKIEGKIEK